MPGTNQSVVNGNFCQKLTNRQIFIYLHVTCLYAEETNNKGVITDFILPKAKSGFIREKADGEKEKP